MARSRSLGLRWDVYQKRMPTCMGSAIPCALRVRALLQGVGTEEGLSSVVSEKGETSDVPPRPSARQHPTLQRASAPKEPSLTVDFTVLSSLPYPNDVRFVFPRPDGTSLELWANSTILGEASPYLKTALESRFVEGSKESAKRRKKDKGAAIEQPSVYDAEGDSDAEGDDVIAEFERGSKKVHDDHQYHELTPEACYTTYRAFLAWLHSGHIVFAAPHNDLAHPASNAAERLQVLRQTLANKPSAVLPTSPRSLFELAHLLDVVELQHLAFHAIERQLTRDTVASLLFSKTAMRHEAVKKEAVDFATQQWGQVRQSAGWVAVDKMVQAGEGDDHYAAVAFELLKKVVITAEERDPPSSSSSSDTSDSSDSSDED